MSSIAVKITGDKMEKMPLGLVWVGEAGGAGKRPTDGYFLQTKWWLGWVKEEKETKATETDKDHSFTEVGTDGKKDT